MKTFELWAADQYNIGYMLDRCIIAKMIESTGNHVPDDFSIYYGGYYETVDSAEYFYTIQEYLTLSKIGVLKFRDRENSEYMGDISIRLFALEELAYYQLSSEQLADKVDWMRELEYRHDFFDATTIEAVCRVVGTCIFYSVHFAIGRASEFCMMLESIHLKASKMINEIRQNSNKGEKKNASNSHV